MLQYLIKVPAMEKIKALKEIEQEDLTISDEAQKKFKDTNSQLTNDILWNTRVYKGHKLINFVTKMSLEEFENYIKEEKLAWAVLAANDGTK